MILALLFIVKHFTNASVHFLADYWKSNERKYCDFCKCWIADNKISVSLHEDGKRHKENVAKKITDINKRSFKDHKAKIKIEEEMSKMEKNAMAAYLKDIESNADLTSQIINEKLAEADRRVTSQPKAVTPKESGESSSSSDSKKSKKWQQAKSDDGHIYYWNTETNEAVWEPPAEGFVSISDLKVPQKAPKKPKGPPTHPHKKHGISAKKQKFQASKDIVPIPLPVTNPLLTLGPQPRGDPYGTWKTINTKPIKLVDLQLPEKKLVIPAIPVIVVPPEKIFKEKQAVSASLDDDDTGVIGFKKRKFNNAAKRNTRQRLDDD